GQCVVVKDQVVVAVEAVEGTDEAVRRGGKLARSGAVVVKRFKPQQDRRFDLPAIGPGTIRAMADCGAAVLAIEAGRAVFVDRARAVAIAGRHGCRAVTDYHELLPDVEAVSVVTPTLLHHVIARACLAAGRHVLVEKPLAATVAEASDLVAAAADRGVTLQVGHIERFNAA